MDGMKYDDLIYLVAPLEAHIAKIRICWFLKAVKMKIFERERSRQEFQEF